MTYQERMKEMLRLSTAIEREAEKSLRKGLDIGDVLENISSVTDEIKGRANLEEAENVS